jgi:uncharacterized delta-60 repeat protein
VLDTFNSFRIDSNKLLVVAGSSKNTDGGTELSLSRYSATGALDTTFASSGIFHSGITGAAGATGASVSDIGNSLQVDSQGRYIVAGSSVNSDGHKEMTIWRFNPDGTPDTSWGTQGIIHSGTTGVAGGKDANLEDMGRAVWVDSKNRYVVAGSSKNSSGGTELALWRYLDTGALDTSFNGTGTLHFGSSGNAGATDALTQDIAMTLGQDPNSNYVITGTSRNTNLGKELAIWKYREDGQLEANFNSSGYLHFGFAGSAGATGAYVNDVPYAAVVDSIGTYTLVGHSQNTDTGPNGKELAIWRYLDLGLLNR